MMCKYLFVVVPRSPSQLSLVLVVIPITDRLSKYLSGRSKLKRLGDSLVIPTSQYFRMFAQETVYPINAEVSCIFYCVITII
jgi:hypothetical protein